ncbi:MAG TPA: FAD:protein FMN transferase [Oligoflexus sp.]|uniref:FAD:protein FMN transferase n=1 Tax=Oligoflexus sp. TaxID=1971216 RepID=UPI002D80570B|nr:FAD:protein FMN transferase [Oligoflexus sp.]HET9235608.1 FAD:protein FMN transferase [Oligoflexus sp.]
MRVWFWPLFVGSLLLPLTAQSKGKTEPHILEGAAQGSTWRVLYNGKEQPGLQALVEKELAAFDKIFSNYRPDSDISRFNQQSGNDWFAVDPDLVTLVDYSHKVSEKTRGAFDITVGPLLKVWGFGPFKTKDHKVPSDADITAAQKEVDYKKLLSRKKPPALKKLIPHLHVDLSGVAQGYSVDKIAGFLEKRGIKSYMVEIGGEIKTKGKKLDGSSWTLGIDTPDNSGEVAAVLKLDGLALTTAGDYREYFEKDGKRYSHTIDPRTGRPIQHDLASVTVIAPMTWEADAWDTALMVLGPEESRKILAQEKQLSVYMILHQGQGFRTESLGGFQKYLSEDSKR